MPASKCRRARNGVDALTQVKLDRPDVVTLDINMPEMDGMTCLSRLMTDDPLPVVMVSSLTAADAPLTFEALELGAVDYVLKPGATVSLDIDTVRRDLVMCARPRKRGSAAPADCASSWFASVNRPSLQPGRPRRELDRNTKQPRCQPHDGRPGGPDEPCRHWCPILS